jgi:polyphenol oxidase
MLEALQAENLLDLTGVRHGFFTRVGGAGEGGALNCDFSDGNDHDVMENRRRVAESLGVDAAKLLSCFQVHSADVVTVSKAWGVGERPKADAMVTREKGLALGVLTADCVPVLFADAKAGVIGAAHAGWRGALIGILENTLEAMEALGASRGAVRAAIGPCIWQSSYEVGPEFLAPFLAEDPAHEKLFRPAFRPGHYLFDLPGYVAGKLCALGVRDVEGSTADTCADEARFFSHRWSCLSGKPRGGSQVSAILLV